MRKKRPRLLYFAYGANMNAEQIATRCEDAKLLTRAHLPDHTLAFHGHSKRWGGAQETASPCPGQTLFGVVYQLSIADFDRLDIWQGVRMDGTGSYFHFPAQVIGEGGESHDILFYKKTAFGPPTLPSSEYLAHILSGARARGLPPVSIDALAARNSRPAGYPVPTEDKTAKFLLSGLACSC
jgi:hypothetical protein